MNGGGVDSEPPTIYQEMYTGALYLDKPTEVKRFDAAFEAIGTRPRTSGHPGLS